MDVANPNDIERIVRAVLQSINKGGTGAPVRAAAKRVRAQGLRCVEQAAERIARESFQGEQVTHREVSGSVK